MSFGNSNGLNAVLRFEGDVQRRVLKRLSKNQLLTQAIQKEHSLWTIGEIIGLCKVDITEEQIVPILLEKLNRCEDPFFYAHESLKYLAEHCKKNNKDIFELLDYQALLDNFISHRTFASLAYYFFEDDCLKDILQEFFSRMDSANALRVLERIDGLEELGDFFSSIEDFSSCKIKELFISLLDPLVLATQLEKLETSKQLRSSIWKLRCLGSKALEICQKVNTKTIAEIFNESLDTKSVCSGLFNFKQISPDLVLQIWQDVNCESFVSKCISKDDPSVILGSIETMLRLHPSIAKDVCNNIDTDMSVDRLRHDVVFLCKFFKLVSEIDGVKGKDIWKAIGPVWLADKLRLSSDIKKLTDSLHHVGFADKKKYTDLIKCFDDDWLVKFLDETDEPDSVVSFLSLVCSFDEDHLRKLWGSISKDRLFDKIGEISDINLLQRCLIDINSLSCFLEIEPVSFSYSFMAKVAEGITKADIHDAAFFLALPTNIQNATNLYRILGADFLLSLFNNLGDIKMAFAIFRGLSEHEPVIAKEVAKSFKIKPLAKKIDCSGEFFDTVMFVYWLRKIYPGKAKRLWKKINMDVLGARIGGCSSVITFMESLGRLESLDRRMASKLIRKFPPDEFKKLWDQMTEVYKLQITALIKRCDKKLYNQIFS